MKILFIILFCSTSLWAKQVINLFYIERNKNSNQVHYDILVSPGCTLEGEVIKGHWKVLEEKPPVIEDFNMFDRMAYGIVDQKIEGDTVYFFLKAVEERKIKVRVWKEKDQCQVEAQMMIAGAWNKLKRIYVFAKEGLIMPTVKYIDIFGVSAEGKEIKEQIIP